MARYDLLCLLLCFASNGFSSNLGYQDQTGIEIITQSDISYEKISIGTSKAEQVAATSFDDSTEVATVLIDFPEQLTEGCTYTLEVKIDMTNISAPNDTLGSFSAEIKWDRDNLKQIGNIEILSDFQGVFAYDPINERLIVNGINPYGSIDTVALFKLTYEVIGAPENKDLVEINFRSLASIGLKNLLSETKQDSFLIEEQFILGDFDGDGVVGIIDAQAILMYEVGFRLPSDVMDKVRRFGDLNGDGYIDATDGLVISTYDLGIETGFDIGSPICVNIESLSDKTPTKERQKIETHSSKITLTEEYINKEAIKVGVTVDLDNTDDNAAAVSGSIEWDTKKLKFLEVDLDETNFKSLVYKVSEAGNLRFSGTNPLNKLSTAKILQLKFLKITKAASLDDIKTKFNSISSASFDSFLPANVIKEKAIMPTIGKETNITVYPNPTDNAPVTIAYSLAKANNVEIKVFDLHGREVATILKDTSQDKGVHKIYWNPSNTTQTLNNTGQYIIQVKIGGYVTNKRLVVINEY